MHDEIQQRMEVENWRMVQWERIGFPITKAVFLASDESVDWHDVETFLAEHPNCDPETALEIVR